MTEARRLTIVSAPPYRVGLIASRLVPALSERGFDVDLVDLSTDPDRLGDHAPEGLLFGDDLGIVPVVRYAVEHPDRVPALVLSAPTLTPNTVTTNAIAELVERPELDRGVSATALSLVRAGQLFSPERMADDDFITEYLDGLENVPPETATERAAIEALADQRVEQDALQALDRPCLVLAYAGDAFASKHQVAAFAALLGDAEVVTLPTGHGGGIEDPTAVADAVAAFVEQLR